MALNTLLVLTGLLAIAFAQYEVAYITPCKGVPLDACTVKEVRIDPCKTHKTKICKLTKGETAQIEFDFTPNFNATNLQNGVFYRDIQFAGMDSNDACLYTACPTVAGQSQRYNYGLRISKKLPKGTFPMQWKVWNADNRDEVCCFVTSISLPV